MSSLNPRGFSERCRICGVAPNSGHRSGGLETPVPKKAVKRYGYGSIPINTIFNGMNIHESQLFWCELQGYYWFWHTAILQLWLPSGKLSHSYGKSPFFMGKSTISMAMFNSYVSLLEGMTYQLWLVANGQQSLKFTKYFMAATRSICCLVVSDMAFIFHFIYGMSSFPLTHIFSRWLLHHQPVCMPTRYVLFIYPYIYTYYISIYIYILAIQCTRRHDRPH